jgi:SAM-dependent methyltransferase
MASRNSRKAPVSGPDSRFAGVLAILRYNWHFYAASLVALIVIGALLDIFHLPSAVEALLIAGAALTAFWAFSSLFVSWYVYDCKEVTRWNWLPSILAFTPQHWLNIHAGLDQSTLILAQFFPKTDYKVLDIYDPEEMTEPSIARARTQASRLQTSTQPALAAQLDALPLPDRDRDTIFLLFAAHEIRDPARRTQFFREAARVLANSGQLLLVEHLRDWKNFVAFGPGFLHFHSRAEWLRVARTAGFTITREHSITPFVRYFLLTRPGV